MDDIRAALYEILSEDHPQTVRGVFYQATSRGIIDKTEAEYKGTVCRLLANMRREQLLPYEWLSDSTRWMRKPDTYSSLENALWSTCKYYRRSIWNDQPVYVEVWVEKEALAGVLYDETERWDVPLMVTRGYPSLSFLYSAADCIRSQRKPTCIYFFGDYDPSGVDIGRTVEKNLRDFSPDSNLYFERVAVNPRQIEEWNLPTRPTKKTDTRAKNFKGDSVELDAIPAKKIRQMVSECILQHLDEGTLEGIAMTERAEKETFENILYSYEMYGSA